MWKETIHSISSNLSLKNPATKEELIEIQKCLLVELPNDLSQLLQETNGIAGEYGDFIWSVSKIKTENMNMRNIVDFKDLYMPFDCLLFFADGGNGDLFGYSILNGIVQRDDIYVWNHENDSRTWVAPSLEIFMEWWESGKITI
ncbi:cell wall assembly protein [Bacillus thuringiensis]|uniref:SMI1/KNR4 family protein n=3 Tax=Bacillus cereus group TaxID=86661 RepID=A0ABD4LDT1_BACCE|nr:MULTISPECIES: SMI1/KNR4 family protein [Bacillus cereus group]ACO30637.1 SMI1/KNR4 family protein [Bacillus cereus 03BB102]AJG56490.1 SMI1 / KNR4 family protein [Bacillus cereus 03BB102]AJG56886.1 SMI1 / KNR4 family protein [Bacillus cereus D17]KXY59724.1 cell wall assembly protein [Bacillus cereus]KXY87448.1 cell wall assembly protein [Bacillus cereus]